MKKKILTITSLIILLIAVVGFWGYNKYFKPAPEIKQQLYNQFGAGFFNSFPAKTGTADDSELKVDNSRTTAEPEKAEEKPSQTVPPAGAKKSGQVEEESQTPLQEQNQTSAQEQNQTPTTTIPSVNANNPSKQITEQNIVNKYMPQINSLQNLALSRLGTLYAAAKTEYQQDKKAGTLNVSALVQKYIQAGNMLEANVDGQFNTILNQMQAELVSNHLPTDQIGIIRNEYEQAKAAMRSQLLAKVLH